MHREHGLDVPPLAGHGVDDLAGVAAQPRRVLEAGLEQVARVEQPVLGEVLQHHPLTGLAAHGGQNHPVRPAPDGRGRCHGTQVGGPRSPGQLVGCRHPTRGEDALDERHVEVEREHGHAARHVLTDATHVRPRIGRAHSCRDGDAGKAPAGFLDGAGAVAGRDRGLKHHDALGLAHERHVPRAGDYDDAGRNLDRRPRRNAEWKLVDGRRGAGGERGAHAVGDREQGGAAAQLDRIDDGDACREPAPRRVPLVGVPQPARLEAPEREQCRPGDVAPEAPEHVAGIRAGQLDAGRERGPSVEEQPDATAPPRERGDVVRNVLENGVGVGAQVWRREGGEQNALGAERETLLGLGLLGNSGGNGATAQDEGCGLGVGEDGPAEREGVAGDVLLERPGVEVQPLGAAERGRDERPLGPLGLLEQVPVAVREPRGLRRWRATRPRRPARRARCGPTRPRSPLGPAVRVRRRERPRRGSRSEAGGRSWDATEGDSTGGVRSRKLRPTSAGAVV